jgi:hypothetical protein
MLQLLRSAALLHDKPAALFVREVEFPHGGSFGRCPFGQRFRSQILLRAGRTVRRPHGVVLPAPPVYSAYSLAGLLIVTVGLHFIE